MSSKYRTHFFWVKRKNWGGNYKIIYLHDDGKQRNTKTNPI